MFIGSNVILGAGSVVTRDIPDHTVAAGNPAKALMTLEQYYHNVVAREYEEANEQARAYFECVEREPAEDIFCRSYFFLFLERNRETYPEVIMQQVGLHLQHFRKSNALFSSCRAFLDACFKGTRLSGQGQEQNFDTLSDGTTS